MPNDYSRKIVQIDITEDASIHDVYKPKSHIYIVALRDAIDNFRALDIRGSFGADKPDLSMYKVKYAYANIAPVYFVRIILSQNKNNSEYNTWLENKVRNIGGKIMMKI